jgi:hypothetical protein
MERVSPGDRFKPSAHDWNELGELVRSRKMQVNGGGGESGLVEQGVTVIQVKNESGEDLQRRSILGLGEPLALPTGDDLDKFKNQRVFRGAKPTTDHLGKFVILLESLAKDAIGDALLVGLSQVQISVDDEQHDRADVEPDELTRLKSRPDGAARILWKESGTGTKWALVCLGPPPARIPFANDSGEEIPAYAVMRLTGDVDSSHRLKVSKPNDLQQKFFLVNGSVAVPSGGNGRGSWLSEDAAPSGLRVAFDSVDGTPGFGESWGAKSGQWTVAKFRAGFTVLGDADTTANTVVALQREVNVGVRWFRIYTTWSTFSSFSSCGAKYAVWDESTQDWLATGIDATLYDVYKTNRAGVGDLVRAWYSPNGRWEILPLGVQPMVDYYINKGVQGFGGTAGSPFLDASFRRGWIGASYKMGDEATVGLQFLKLETNPSTNGNWLVLRDGLYRICFHGQVYTEVGTTVSTPTKNWVTAAGLVGTANAHIHVVTLTDFETEYQSSGPDLAIELWTKKAAGGAIALHLDDIGGQYDWHAQMPYWPQKIIWVPIQSEWNVNLSAGDRIGFKFNWGHASTIWKMGFGGEGLRLRATYLGAKQPWVAV